VNAISIFVIDDIEENPFIGWCADGILTEALETAPCGRGSVRQVVNLKGRFLTVLSGCKMNFESAVEAK
jgi:hypothetical protein